MDIHRLTVQKYFHRLLLQKAILNFGINIVINFVIQYFSLKTYDVLTVFGTGQSLVKVFLPLAFLLPFFVTIDTIGFVYKMMKKKKLHNVFKKDFKPLLCSSKIGALNGLGMLLVGTITLLVLHSTMNGLALFDKESVLIFQVSLSGILAIIFTYQPFLLLKFFKLFSIC